ncbi:MAG: hypothetical protein GKR90_13005 [Pseudomonadales bacterium]|nr:hypothetical protein [Pseudomonadales bacterium]
MPQHAEAIAPPRALAVPYSLGRPLGVPNDPDFQHRVLSAALALLQEWSDPIIVTYEEDAPDDSEVEETWVCPVSFATQDEQTSLVSKVLNEMALLRPWYEKGKDSRATTVGVSGLDIEQAVQFTGSFLDGTPPEAGPVENVRVVDLLKYAVEDIKAFYNEAAASQPGTASVQAMEDWYWGETAAGELIRAVKKALAHSEDRMIKITSSLLLVPGSQAFRDSA